MLPFRPQDPTLPRSETDRARIPSTARTAIDILPPLGATLWQASRRCATVDLTSRVPPLWPGCNETMIEHKYTATYHTDTLTSLSPTHTYILSSFSDSKRH